MLLERPLHLFKPFVPILLSSFSNTTVPLFLTHMGKAQHGSSIIMELLSALLLFETRLSHISQISYCLWMQPGKYNGSSK